MTDKPTEMSNSHYNQSHRYKHTWTSKSSIHKYQWRHVIWNSTMIIINVFGYDIESAHTCSNNYFFLMGRVGRQKILYIVVPWTMIKSNQLQDAMSISYWQSTYWHVQSLTMYVTRSGSWEFLISYLSYYLPTTLDIHTCKWIHKVL